MGLLRRMTRAELESGEFDYEAFLDELASGKSLARCCEELTLSAHTVLNWIRGDAGREAQYERALKVHAEVLAHECLEIADERGEAERRDGTTFDPDVQRDKLRVDTRLKLLSKWDRPRYGENAGVSINLGSNSLVSILSGMSSAPQIAEQDAIEGEVTHAEPINTPEKIPEKNTEILPVRVPGAAPLVESDVMRGAVEQRQVKYI